MLPGPPAGPRGPSLCQPLSLQDRPKHRHGRCRHPAHLLAPPAAGAGGSGRRGDSRAAEAGASAHGACGVGQRRGTLGAGNPNHRGVGSGPTLPPALTCGLSREAGASLHIAARLLSPKSKTVLAADPKAIEVARSRLAPNGSTLARRRARCASGAARGWEPGWALVVCLDTRHACGVCHGCPKVAEEQQAEAFKRQRPPISRGPPPCADCASRFNQPCCRSACAVCASCFDYNRNTSMKDNDCSPLCCSACPWLQSRIREPEQPPRIGGRDRRHLLHCLPARCCHRGQHVRQQGRLAALRPRFGGLDGARREVGAVRFDQQPVRCKMKERVE